MSARVALVEDRVKRAEDGDGAVLPAIREVVDGHAPEIGWNYGDLTCIVENKWIARIWREQGLKVPRRYPKRGRLRLNDGSCMGRRAERPNHVWSYDFVFDRTQDGRPLRMLVVVDEYTRECLAIDVGRRFRSEEVLETLSELFVEPGTPAYIPSDNGPEFTAAEVRQWLKRLGVEMLFIEPGRPWENGYVESFNGNLRDELLNGEIFYALMEAQILIERSRREYNRIRPHGALGYRPPAPKEIEIGVPRPTILAFNT